ncbi:MAG: GTP cyclohydrolase II [Gammaproteobacteria bacterium]
MASMRNKIKINTKYGPCSFVTFNDLEPEKEHFALIFKDADTHQTPLVRVHSECITGDLFGSFICDCGDQLSEAMNIFSEKGGILLYLRQEGRGIGLYNKIDAYALQEKGFDTYEANCLLDFPGDMRSFEVASAMLKIMSLKNIKLLSNNPDKYNQLTQNGIHILKMINTRLYLKEDNKEYLQTKIKKAGHLFSEKI